MPLHESAVNLLLYLAVKRPSTKDFRVSRLGKKFRDLTIVMDVYMNMPNEPLGVQVDGLSHLIDEVKEKLVGNNSLLARVEW